MCTRRFGRAVGSLRYWLNYFCVCLSFGGKTVILTALLREASAQSQTLLTLTIPSAAQASVISGRTCVFFICSGERWEEICSTIERFSYDL